MASKKKKNKNAPKYISVSKPKTKTMPTYTPGTYESQYGDQLTGALDKVTNFKYDPLQDASYQALAKIYGARGNIAAKDTLGDAAALNGGYGTSYAVSAAQQARNQYNQELAALIPDLEANAFNRAQTTYNALRDADDTAYGRFRDTEGDRQFQFNANYNKYRDLMGDYQWGKGYNLDVANYKLSKKNSAGGGGSGGGGRRSSGGGGGYVGGSTGGGSGMPLTAEDLENAGKRPAVKKTTKKTATTKPKKTVNSKSTSGGKYYTSKKNLKRGGIW